MTSQPAGPSARPVGVSGHRSRIVLVVDEIDVLWTSGELQSAEHFRLESTDRGAMLSGTVVIPFENHPAHLRYEVHVDMDWRTRNATVELVGHRSVRIVVTVDNGEWTVDGQSRPDLAGAVDIDLGWTPATNVLPIRRLAPVVGDSVEVSTAWVRYPEMIVVLGRQRYERVTETQWRYLSGPYDFLLDTTADGIVTRYGDDLWVADLVHSRTGA